MADKPGTASVVDTRALMVTKPADPILSSYAEWRVPALVQYLHTNKCWDEAHLRIGRHPPTFRGPFGDGPIDGPFGDRRTNPHPSELEDRMEFAWPRPP
jgi:hypothetical protein